MNHLSARVVRLQSVVVGTLLPGVMAFVAIDAPAQARDLAIGVHADHYVVAGRSFDDLDSLESAVRATAAPSVSLESCEPAATRGLLAAVHRFSDLPLSVRSPNSSAPSCSGAAVQVRVGLRAGATPAGIDDGAVQRYWMQVAP